MNRKLLTIIIIIAYVAYAWLLGISVLAAASPEAGTDRYVLETRGVHTILTAIIMFVYSVLLCCNIYSRSCYAVIFNSFLTGIVLSFHFLLIAQVLTILCFLFGLVLAGWLLMSERKTVSGRHEK